MKKTIITIIAVGVLALCAGTAYLINNNVNDLDETPQNDSLVYFKKNTNLPDNIDVFAKDGEKTSDITPAMWQVTAPNGKSMYMLGTMHVQKEESYPLPEYIEQAYRGCDKLASEINNVDADPFYESSAPDPALKKGDSLKKHLTDEQYSDLKNYFSENGIDISDYDKYAPWYVFQQLNALGESSGDFSATIGIDRVLKISANCDDKENLSIETHEAKDTMYSSMPEDVIGLLIKKHCTTTKEQSAAALEEQYDAWKTGDTERLCELTYDYSGLTDEEKPIMEKYYQQFVIDRNKIMAEKAKEYLEQDYQVFFIAGVSHFVGDEGIPELLKKDGYTVERVN